MNKKKFVEWSCDNCGVIKPANEFRKKNITRIGSTITESGEIKRKGNKRMFLSLFGAPKGSNAANNPQVRAAQEGLWGSGKHKIETTQRVDVHETLKLCFDCFYSTDKSGERNTSKLVLHKTSSFIVWSALKTIGLLRFIGIKIIDRNSDGKIDKKDFEIMYTNVSNFFRNLRKKISGRKKIKDEKKS